MPKRKISLGYPRAEFCVVQPSTLAVPLGCFTSKAKATAARAEYLRAGGRERLSIWRANTLRRRGVNTDWINLGTASRTAGNTNFQSFSARIKGANTVESLQKLEKSLDRLYNAGQLSVNEYKRLDTQIFEKIAAKG
jgi:hypothetical protein